MQKISNLAMVKEAGERGPTASMGRQVPRLMLLSCWTPTSRSSEANGRETDAGAGDHPTD